MGQTLTEKILAAHCGRKEVHPGEFINVKLDFVMGNDITTPLAVAAFRKIGVDKVWDSSRIALVASHYAPNKDIRAAQQCQVMRDFAFEQGLEYYFEVGRGGIEHALLPQEGLVVPGDCMIGADSHSCTYGALGCFSTGIGSTDFAAAMATGECWLRVPESIKFVYHGPLQPWVVGKDLILHTIGLISCDGALYQAMEFCGETISQLSMPDRFTLTNMVVEAGGKNGVVQADKITTDFIRDQAKRPWEIYESDPDATYARVYEIDCEKIEPQIALPPRPDIVRPLSQVEPVPLDQVFIGSCTNGRLEDLRVAADILKGRQVHRRVRLIVIPATHQIQLQAVREGLAEIFLEAGAAFSESSCGPCLGGSMGVLGPGEVCLSTSNRNFIGRMGHPDAKVYLANPAVAAASAVLGRIGHPEELN